MEWNHILSVLKWCFLSIVHGDSFVRWEHVLEIDGPKACKVLQKFSYKELVNMILGIFLMVYIFSRILHSGGGY